MAAPALRRRREAAFTLTGPNTPKPFFLEKTCCPSVQCSTSHTALCGLQKSRTACTPSANRNVHRSQRKSEDPAKTTYSIFALLSCPYSSRALEAHGLQHVRRQWQEPACDKVRERKNRRSVRVTCSASSWACSQPSWRRNDAPEECICHAVVACSHHMDQHAQGSNLAQAAHGFC